MKNVLAIWIAILVVVVVGASAGATVPEVSPPAPDSTAAVGNPAAVYCTDLGYVHDIVSGATGQVGVCRQQRRIRGD